MVKLGKGAGKAAEISKPIPHKDNVPTSLKNIAPKVSDASSRKRTVTNISANDCNETNDNEGEEESKSKKKKPDRITQKKGVTKVKKPNKDTEEDKDDSKDFAPKRRKSIDSDTSKVPKKKPKNNKDIPEYVTRSNEKSKSQDKKGKEKSTNKSAADTKSSEREIEGTEERNVLDEVEEDSGFNCPFCKKTYKNYVNFKAHKIICGSKGKKVSCPKCGKGLYAKSLMEQHFDYMHTNKPKRFICKIHNKAFELKKTLDEHNMRLHNSASYKFQCDICGRGFFHRNEFTLHRAQHSNLRPFLCGQCKDRAFSTEGKLRAHLAKCGQPSKFECTICGKFYSSSSNLGTHVSDVHKNDVTWRCPLCKGKMYSSHGGYYTHL